MLRAPMKDPVHKSVLGNGLRVVTVELPHLHAGMLAAYVRAGSRHEDPRVNVSGRREDDLRAHHARAYGARNLVVCAAGPVQHREVVRLAERSFGQLPPGTVVTDTPLLRGARGPRLVAVEHRESQTEVRLSFAAAAEDHRDFPAPLLLRRILDDGLAARLQLNVVERKGLAYAVHGSIDTFSDCSVVGVEAACASHKVPLVLAELLRLLAELCDEDVPSDELRRAKVRHRIGLES